MPKPIDKRKKAIEEQVFYNLLQIVQSFPQYTIAQHLAHVLRKKQELEEFYYWNDEKLLKKFEEYRDELDRELAGPSLSDFEALAD
jgi:triphosphoribosyl-dephospho-CoA synthetase